MSQVSQHSSACGVYVALCHENISSCVGYQTNIRQHMSDINRVTVPAAVCRLGDRKFAVGEALGLTDCKLDCRCVTPPELTCIQYKTCDIAAEKGEAQGCGQGGW